jgi:drug/metabolite transporter (DMT)-like permease
MSNQFLPSRTPLLGHTINNSGRLAFTDITNTSPSIPPMNSPVIPLRWFLVQIAKAQDTDESLARWSSFIGICIAIAGNVLISLALNIQKYAHTRLERDALRQRTRRLRARRMNLAQARIQRASFRDSSEGFGLVTECDEDVSEESPLLSQSDSRHSLPANDSARRDVDDDEHEASTAQLDFGKTHTHFPEAYIRSPYWWLGFFLMFVGECGNFLAYGFAPASIVSPLGVVALVCNCVIAPVMLKESFRGRDILGMIVSVIGAVTVVWSAEKLEIKLGPDEILDAISQTAFKVYFVATCALIVILMYLSSRSGHKTSTIDLGLVALFGGYTVLSTKGISSLISSSFYHIFQYPIAYLFTFILVSTAILQVKYINRALQRFDSTQVIPTQFVLFTISVIIGSAILYRDFETVELDQIFKFMIGCGFTFLGVYLISSQRSIKGFVDESSSTGDGGSEQYVPIASVALPSGTAASGSRLDTISVPPSTARPIFNRGFSTASSNAISLHDPTPRPDSPNVISGGPQSATVNALYPESDQGRTPTRKRSEGDLLSSSGVGFLPGSNLLTGYQLQTVIAEHVGGSLRKPRSRSHAGQPTAPTAEDELGVEGGDGSVRPRRGSLSVVMDFVKGKRKSFNDNQHDDNPQHRSSED